MLLAALANFCLLTPFFHVPKALVSLNSGLLDVRGLLSAVYFLDKLSRDIEILSVDVCIGHLATLPELPKESDAEQRLVPLVLSDPVFEGQEADVALVKLVDATHAARLEKSKCAKYIGSH
jgi:hypothetical protein